MGRGILLWLLGAPIPIIIILALIWHSIMDPIPAGATGRAPAVGNEASSSAVSRRAIFAGTFAALAASIVLITLGTGLGLTTISAWPNAGASVTTFTISAASVSSSFNGLPALGGFITGRLRTKWTGLHTHEVFFRDTAHGFLSWALTTIVGTVLFAAATSSIISGSVRTASTVAGGGHRR